MDEGFKQYYEIWAACGVELIFFHFIKAGKLRENL